MKPITLGWDLGGTQVKHILMDQGGRVLGHGIDPFQSIDSVRKYDLERFI